MFKVERCCQGGRLGRLGNVPTPSAVLHCSMGAPRHLQRDLLESLPDPFVMHVPVGGLVVEPGPSTMEKYGDTYASFANLPGVVLFSAFEPGRQPPDQRNSDSQISIWTRVGRQKVGTKLYARLLRACSPAIAVALPDVQSSHVSDRRHTKAVQRTSRYVQQLHDELGTTTTTTSTTPQIWAPIVGGRSPEIRQQAAQALAADTNVQGFTLEGLNTGETSQETLNALECMKELPASKPRLVHGISRLDEIIAAIEAGADLFDSHFCYEKAEDGHAFVLDLETPPQAPNPNPLFIDLWSDQYQTDMTPLLPGCQCYACTNFTRAYIHHLHLTHEMLGTVLLTLYAETPAQKT
ncbi:hypothetical protein PTSG_11433, partial [Salpingoeca rosetta]